MLNAFRIKHKAALRDKARDRMRAKRAAAKAGKTQVVKPLPETPSDKAAALCQWARASLIVPARHPRAGEAFEIPPYLIEFFRDALADDCHEAALVIARKNAKSAGVAALVLGCLTGPLKAPGWRAGICSLSREKAGELRAQI